MRRILPILIIMLLFASCAGRHFVFEYEGEPFAANGMPFDSGCSVAVVPEGTVQPGFRVITTARVPERVEVTRVEAKAVTNWEIHGYEPDVMLMLGGALSTVAGVVVTPAWCLKGLFTGWGPPKDEAEMRARIYDRHLRSWLFMGYLWAPVDYDVLDRRRSLHDTGHFFEAPGFGRVEVTVLDDRRRPVEMISYADGLYRPDVTDALLESSALHVTAYCNGASASSSIDLLPWYRQAYALTREEAQAFRGPPKD